ncbi:MAG: alpha/beta hydrolase [Pseudomonadota bacterium]
MRIIAGALVLLLAACAGSAVRLAAPPNILVGLGTYPDAAIPPHKRTTTPRIFFVTDRARITSDKKQAAYGFGRSRSMAFGYKNIAFGEGLTWDQLRARSVTRGRSDVTLSVVNSVELVRFPETPLPFQVAGSRAVPASKPLADYRAAGRAFKAAVAAELSRANRKEIVLYTHGVNNDFEDAADTIANLWHYSGRIGMPLVFSWPADNPGLLGYFSDRESGEFAVFHFKEMMRLLAEIPQLKHIHVIAHSRGTDLATTALREMLIAERAAGRDPRRTLKVKNVILAAPDLNMDVVSQRLVAERFAAAFDQITVYMNGGDAALGLAQSLFTGVRLGRLRPEDLSAEELKILDNAQRVHFVNVENVSTRSSHGYFRSNPNVVSDIVLTLRTGAEPGGNQRPLEPEVGNFWTMHRGYPFGRPVNVFDTTPERP